MKEVQIKKINGWTLMVKNEALYLNGINLHSPRKVKDISEITMEDAIIYNGCYMYIEGTWKLTFKAVIKKIFGGK